MYMSYVLDYCCGKGGDVLEDSFILTTDADIVFSYSSVRTEGVVGRVCMCTDPSMSDSRLTVNVAKVHFSLLVHSRV